MTDDWTAPGVEQVAPGVHRVPLPLPQDGLRAVNVYVLETADGLVLIDAGWAIPRSRALLESALATLEATPADITRFLVTHVHRDHYTQAVDIRRTYGTRVGLGRGERPTIELLQGRDRPPLAAQMTLLRRLGAPELADTIAAAAGNVPVDPSMWESPDDWLAPGQLELAGGRVLEAVETPGHTAGHLVFHDTGAGLLFAGDHVLPRITPSIGFEPVPTTDPLGAFLRSLALVRARPDALLLPAHGPVAPSVHDRVDELVDHHGQRLEQMEALAAGNDLTARDVASQVGWTRRQTPYADLDPFNAMLATFETGAHLELLAVQGRLTSIEADAVLRYR